MEGHLRRPFVVCRDQVSSENRPKRWVRAPDGVVPWRVTGFRKDPSVNIALILLLVFALIFYDAARRVRDKRNARSSPTPSGQRTGPRVLDARTKTPPQQDDRDVRVRSRVG